MQLDGHGQRGEGGSEVLLHVGRVRDVPGAAVRDVVPSEHEAQRLADGHVLVVARDSVKPGLGQPLQRAVGLGATVNQVAHGNRRSRSRLKPTASS